MTSTRRNLSALLLVLAIIVSLVLYSSDENASQLGQVVMPEPVLLTKASQCVAPTDIIRRDHMKLLSHQRDLTVISGIRSEQFSLNDCISCHNPVIENTPTLHYEDPEHFCAGCHLFTAVKIDCFECHADSGPAAL
jgi:predicted CXXCH cytochrome family protein